MENPGHKFLSPKRRAILSGMRKPHAARPGPSWGGHRPLSCASAVQTLPAHQSLSSQLHFQIYCCGITVPVPKRTLILLNNGLGGRED